MLMYTLNWALSAACAFKNSIACSSNCCETQVRLSSKTLRTQRAQSRFDNGNKADLALRRHVMVSSADMPWPRVARIAKIAKKLRVFAPRPRMIPLTGKSDNSIAMLRNWNAALSATWGAKSTARMGRSPSRWSKASQKHCAPVGVADTCGRAAPRYVALSVEGWEWQAQCHV